jgi:hypothetical protein
VIWQKTGALGLEANILSVDEAYRVTLPQSLCRQSDWISGDQPHSAWLLLGNSGRCRLLSATEVESDPTLQSLQARTTLELTEPSHNPLEFQDEVSAALAFRLMAVEITPRKPGWRLTLPRPVAAIMNIRPKDSDVAALFLQKHIELWTIEALRSAVNMPLTQII